MVTCNWLVPNRISNFSLIINKSKYLQLYIFLNWFSKKFPLFFIFDFFPQLFCKILGYHKLFSPKLKVKAFSLKKIVFVKSIFYILISFMSLSLWNFETKLTSFVCIGRYFYIYSVIYVQPLPKLSNFQSNGGGVVT